MKHLIIIILASLLSLSAFANCELTPKFSYKTKGLQVNFDNRSLGDYTDVRWTFGDGTTISKEDAEHTFDKEGIYTFTLTIYNNEGCSETFEGKVYVFDINRQQEDKEEQEETPDEDAQQKELALAKGVDGNISNYPNPFSEQTTIVLELMKEGEVEVSVMDLSGKLVATLIDEKMGIGQHTILFERKHLAAGTYVVTAQTPSAILTRKITIQ